MQPIQNKANSKYSWCYPNDTCTFINKKHELFGKRTNPISAIAMMARVAHGILNIHHTKPGIYISFPSTKSNSFLLSYHIGYSMSNSWCIVCGHIDNEIAPICEFIHTAVLNLRNPLDLINLPFDNSTIY